MNQYLEKVANALLRAISRGAVTSVNPLGRDGARMGASALNKTLTGASPVGVIRSPQVRRAYSPASGRLSAFREAPTPARNVVTGDILARSSIRSRMASNKADALIGKVKTKPTKTVFGTDIPGKGPAVTPGAAPTGNKYLNAAKGFITTRPKTSAGIGMAGAYLVGQEMGKSKSNYPSGY